MARIPPSLEHDSVRNISPYLYCYGKGEVEESYSEKQKPKGHSNELATGRASSFWLATWGEEKMKMLRRILASVVLIGVLFTFVVSCRNGKEKEDASTEPPTSDIAEGRHAHGGPRVGEKAPVFSLSDMQGSEIHVADMVGKKTLAVAFWGTWCPHCRAEIPALRKLQDTYRDRGFQIVSVAVRDERDPVVKVAEEKDINYTVLLDEKLEAAALYHLHSVPTIVVIDLEGVVRYTGHSAEEAEATLKALLKA